MPAKKRTVDTLLCEQCGAVFPYKQSGRQANRFCTWSCRLASSDPKERFWSKVDKNGPVPSHRLHLGPCWCWLGSCFPSGYGQFWLEGRNRRAHTVAFEWEIGPIPDGLIVCHKCDNPICLRPSHLFADTYKGNAEDRDAKGRSESGDRHWTRRTPERLANKSGTANAMAKLTEADVIQIRRLAAEGVTPTSIATRFGVTRSAIYLIVRRQTWTHVE